MKIKTRLYLLGLVFLLSCTEDELVVSLGDNFINSQTTIALIDTISVGMSTVKLDSIASSAGSYLMVGSYIDEEFGVVSSTAYFQFGSTTTKISDDEIFDSLIIRLPYSGISYGDTLQEQSIEVHRVLEDIEPHDEGIYIYNTSTFNYDKNVLGKKIVRARPNFHDVLEIRLSDEFGLELLDFLSDKNQDNLNSGDFRETFKGIALTPGDETNVLLSFLADTALQLQLFTHVIAEEKIEKTYELSLNNSLNYFNNISSNANGLWLEGELLTQREKLKSGQTGNKSYLQSGIGIVTRIDFTSLSKILEEERDNILYKAELEIKPVPGTYNEVPLPKYLNLYRADKYNNLVQVLEDKEGNTLMADFFFDEFYNESNYYRFDVTDFIHKELADGFVDPNNGLIITMPKTIFCETVDRVVFDARNNAKYRPLLKLYYVFYE